MDAADLFGRKLRELRHRRGYSLRRMADRVAAVKAGAGEDAGDLKSYLSDLERGVKAPPSRRQVGWFTEALRCSEAERGELFLAAGFVPYPMTGPAPEGASPALNGVAVGAPAILPALPEAPGIPRHRFTVRVPPGTRAAPYREGDLLLVGPGSDGAGGTVVLCLAGGAIAVRRLAPAGGEEPLEGVLLGQVVGFLRTDR